MTPSQLDPLVSLTGDCDSRVVLSQDASNMPSVRRRTEESWIEISSRQSSSSLSSTSNNPPNRLPEERASQRLIQLANDNPPRPTSAAGSSQDEYDESSSESDRVMSSSNEDISHEEEDDDRTALGVGQSDTAFTPQPNAFSHPPSSTRSVPNSYFPQVSSTPSSMRHERPHLQNQRTTGSFQPDHDAALRASLTTLLSCAAAVRPKAEKAPESVTTRRPYAQPTTLRLVQETPDSRPVKQVKRKSRESSKERNVRKVRAVKAVPVEETFSPALAAWMISAGVVLVFSAISFSAGYTWGKEVGRVEGELGLTGGSCGREAMRGSGLRKLQWTTTSSSIRA